MNTTKLQSRTIGEGDTAFGFSMMPYLGQGNVAFSPYSIRTALAMVYEGAKGKSAEEISEFALIPADSTTRLDGYSDLMTKLNASNPDFKLKSANGIWVDNNFTLNQDFRNSVVSAYQAEVANADFMNDYEAQRKRINEWVSGKTEGKIIDLFPEGSMDDLTALVLANGVYFKGKWQNKFDIKFTQKQDYTLPTGEKVKVDMMRKGGVEAGEKLPKFMYCESDGVQVARLPYEGHELAKVILLPNSPDTSGLESQLRKNPNKLLEWLGHLRETSFVRFEIPKHEIRAAYSLKEPLQEMGINSIFDRTADLSGMGHGPVGPLYISSGHHQVYFKTDEEGTEAAAATGFVATMRCMIEAPKPQIFVADHPFLEMIVHEPTGSTLFLNRINDPR